MNIKDEINKILNDDQIDYSEDYADCLELMVRLRSLDENDMEYNHIYEEFSKAFSKLNPEEQTNIRKVYELDDAIFEEIAKSDDLQYDYDLKNKIKKAAGCPFPAAYIENQVKLPTWILLNVRVHLNFVQRNRPQVVVVATPQIVVSSLTPHLTETVVFHNRVSC